MQFYKICTDNYGKINLYNSLTSKAINCIWLKEIEFEKGIPAGAVENSRNRRPSPQALSINARDHLEKIFEKVSPKSHIQKKPVSAS